MTINLHSLQFVNSSNKKPTKIGCQSVTYEKYIINYSLELISTNEFM